MGQRGQKNDDKKRKSNPFFSFFRVKPASVSNSGENIPVDSDEPASGSSQAEPLKSADMADKSPRRFKSVPAVGKKAKTVSLNKKSAKASNDKAITKRSGAISRKKNGEDLETCALSLPGSSPFARFLKKLLRRIFDRLNKPIASGYRLLYYIGIQSMRSGIHLLKRIRYRIVRIKGSFLGFAFKLSSKFRRRAGRIIHFLTNPFVDFAHNFNRIRIEMKLEKANPHFPRLAAKAMIRLLLDRAWRLIATILNHTAPVAAFIMMMIILREGGNQTIGLLVEYNGEIIGYIKNEAIFEEAERNVSQRLIYERYTSQNKTSAFTLTEMENSGYSKFTTVDELTDSIILHSGNEIEEATGLYIDNRFIGATTDSNALLLSLNNLLEANSTGEPTEVVSFAKKVQTKDGLYPVSSIIDLRAVEATITTDEAVQETYTVEEGDSPLLVSDKLGVPYSELQLLNPDMDTLHVGQELLVSAARPFLPVQSTVTEVYQEEVEYGTVETKSDDYNTGETVVVKEGKNGLQEVTAEVTRVNGVETGREIKRTMVVKKPVNQEIIVGTKIAPSYNYGNNYQNLPAPSSSTPPPSNPGGFIWPVAGGYVSAGYNGYPGHYAMDIATKVGTPVYAAASGTVTMVKYNRYGYGYHLLIDHGNGYQTLYAHNSVMYVNIGDRVAQGQQIAAIGRTGNVTGPHLHFEIRYYGRYLNPAGYIGTRYR